MPKMTVEEARAFNDHFINNTVTLGPNGSGWLSQQEMRNLGMQNQQPRPEGTRYVVLKRYWSRV